MIGHYLDSMVQLSQVMGIFFSGFLSDKIGRKKSIIAASILTLMSALCVSFCTSFISLATVLGLSTFFSSMVQVNIFFIIYCEAQAWRAGEAGGGKGRCAGSLWVILWSPIFRPRRL